MDKVVLIDKPKGWTSFDVVAKIRNIVRDTQHQLHLKQHTSPSDVQPKIRVGHAGTLDPLATGLLIVLIGTATKKQDLFMKQDKVYEVEMMLGKTSTTADDEGKKTLVSDFVPTKQQVEDTIKKFVGTIQQTPPAYSAIKIDGKRAYTLARAGKEVALKQRSVTVYSISEIEYNYPLLAFTTNVSSGTYIRSLVTDIGAQLGTGAYMSNLRRTSIGTYSVENSTTMDRIADLKL